MKKFTKIRKWAKQNNFEVKEVEGYSLQPCIKVIVNTNLFFEVIEKKSSIHRTIKGIEGNPKGLYLSAQGGKRLGYSFQEYSQTTAIETMEETIKKELSKPI